MSRYGREPNKNTVPIGKLLILCAIIMIGYAVIVLVTADTDPDILCIETMTLMLDDPEHARLHNEYPNLFLNLHDYIDKNCQNVKLPDRISMGSEMEMP